MREAEKLLARSEKRTSIRGLVKRLSSGVGRLLDRNRGPIPHIAEKKDVLLSRSGDGSDSKTRPF